MAHARKITPCLWLDDIAEEGARFYVSIFRDSRIDRVILAAALTEDRGRRP